MPSKTKPKNSSKKKCDNCKKELSVQNFYNTNSVLSADGKLNICKSCVKDIVDPKHIETIYKVLQLLDIPFIYSYWRTAIENNPEDPWGKYITMANSKINEFKKGTWKDSKFEPESINPVKVNMTQVIDTTSSFQVTEEMVRRWGKHNPEDYLKLEEFYWDMKNRNKIETPQEEVYLKKLAIISVKMDNELEAGNYDESKKLGDLFSKYMADSQFRAIDKTEADKTGGIRNFGQIYMEAESDDFIPPWEYYRKIRGLTQDKLDETIMHIENFTLRLNKVSTMSEPPSDTPKLKPEDVYEEKGNE